MPDHIMDDSTWAAEDAASVSIADFEDIPHSMRMHQ
jgi:hypothetical protein